MAYDINASLERLEKNLQDVDSAKKKVEEIQKKLDEVITQLNIHDVYLRNATFNINQELADIKLAQDELLSLCGIIRSDTTSIRESVDKTLLGISMRTNTNLWATIIGILTICVVQFYIFRLTMAVI